MIIQLKNLTGEFPRLAAGAPDNAAQLAQDCEFRHGVLRGIKSRSTVSTLTAAIKSLFVYEPTNRTYTWNRDVDAVRSPIASDEYKRFYWSDGTGFYVSEGTTGGNAEPATTNRWKVGVPRPTSKPGVVDNEFRMVVEALQISLADERLDGTYANEVDIPLSAITKVSEKFSEKWTFTAPRPPANTAGYSQTTTSAGDVEVSDADLTAAKNSYPAPANYLMQFVDGGVTHRLPFSSESQSDPLFNNTPSISTNALYLKHTSKTESFTAMFTATGKVHSSSYTFYRMGTSGWYSNKPTQAADAVVTSSVQLVQQTALALKVMTKSGVEVPLALYTTNSATALKLANGTPLSGTEIDALYFNSSGQSFAKATSAKLTKNGVEFPTNNPTTFYFERVGTSKWWSTHKALATSNTLKNAAVVSVDSDFVGPVLLLKMLDNSRNEVTAKLRSDSTLSTWPSTMSAYEGSMSYSGSTFSVVFGAKPAAVETRAYVYTYVNAYKEEGPPSDPLMIDAVESSQVTVSYTPPPSGYKPITHIRLYRTATGTSTDFYYVPHPTDVNGWPVNTNQPTIADTITNAYKDEISEEATVLGAALSTYNYYPPAQDLKGICVMANGMVAGFRENEVHLMEPYLPYASNPNAIKPFPSKVVGICPFEGGLYVTTTSHPYILMGATPDSVTDAVVPAVQAGVSKGSIVNMGQFVVYATNDGLVTARGLDASLEVSFKFFTRDVWRALYGAKLKQMRLSHHDGSLLVWFDDGTPGFLMRFEEENPSFVRMTEPVFAAFVHPTADALYVASGVTLFSFAGGATSKDFVWHSKDFYLPKPSNLGAIQILGTGAMTVAVYVDDVVRHTQTVTVTNAAILRLPSGFIGRKWSFKVTGQAGAEIYEMNIANTVTEFQRV